MEYQQLGRSSLKVSRIGFGCMSLGNDLHQNDRIINRALDLGINYFDTADLYDHGNNEAMLGKIIKSFRDKVLIATKAGNQWKADGSGWDWNPGKAYILQAAEESLKRLQTDHIDLYQLHGGTMNDPIDETIEAFELLKQQGKIRYYGISSIRPNVIREYVKRSNIVSVMMQYSLLDRRPEESCLDLLADHNIAVLVRGALAQGLLINKPAKAYLDRTEQDIKVAREAVTSVSGPYRTNAQTAVRYVLTDPSVCSVIAGIRTLEQLEDAANTFQTPPLSIADIDMLRHAVKQNHYTEHR